jgi:transposase-like protein
MNTTKTTKTRFSPELRERAVRLVYEQRKEYGSHWATVESVAGKVGCSPQTLDNWIKRREVDTGLKAGVTSDERDRVKALERLPAGSFQVASRSAQPWDGCARILRFSSAIC